MKKSNQGFTLIEITLSIILFAVMLDGLMSFCAHMTYEYSQFKQLEQLKQNAVNVQDFITYYIRTADKVEVVATPVTEWQDKGLREGAKQLKHITCIFETINKKNPGKVEVKQCQLALDEILLTAEMQGSGKYKLVYQVIENNQSKNNNLISDLVDQIIIYEDVINHAVEFECRFKKREEENERLAVTKLFIESLAYKS